jgi:hypothetical protein
LEASKIKEVIKMVRYNGSCEEYCIGAADSEDEVIIAGKEKADIMGKVDELRRQRWGFCTVTMKGKLPEIVVTNQIALEISCENEAEQLKRLAELIQVFNKLNPLFEEVASKFPYLKEPTLKGLEILRTTSINQINKYIERIKREVQFKSEHISSKGRSLDDVLADPNFIKMKKENENYIKIEEDKLKQINYYISEVKKALRGE